MTNDVGMLDRQFHTRQVPEPPGRKPQDPSRNPGQPGREPDEPRRRPDWPEPDNPDIPREPQKLGA